MLVSGLFWCLYMLLIQLFQQKKESSLFSGRVHTGSGDTPLPASCLFSGYMVFFLGIKNLEYEVDHSPPPNTEVKNEQS